MHKLPKFSDPNLLVSGEKLDDAGVYKINEQTALVQTLDFFTPMVDDPYIFGQIAAVNALNDIYAMGSVPLTVMNIVCFPSCLDVQILVEILNGGALKIKEAGAVLVGGHSVEDNEPKYGLAVTGLIDPNKIITNAGAKPGDSLILTKPIGTGIISTAIKGKIAGEGSMNNGIQVMTTLNNIAAMAMIDACASACTDVTGFGLLGHALEMAEASGVTLEIFMPLVPLIEGVYDLASMGIIPGGAKRNLKYAEPKVNWYGRVSDIYKDILADPQTAGGLLIAIDNKKGEQLVKDLTGKGVEARIIGQVNKYMGKPLIVEGL